MTHQYDAVVIGSGPNGLLAAVEIAGAGRSVLVLEAADRPGGGTRTEEVTLPGFRHDVCSTIHPLGLASPCDRILARRTIDTVAVEAHDANYVGGDINGGAADIRQFVLRPVVAARPWIVPADGWYLCSSSVPPGGGVHGMCGRLAARSALARELR